MPGGQRRGCRRPRQHASRGPGNPRNSALLRVPWQVWRPVLPPRQEAAPAANPAAQAGAPAPLRPNQPGRRNVGHCPHPPDGRRGAPGSRCCCAWSRARGRASATSSAPASAGSATTSATSSRRTAGTAQPCSTSCWACSIATFAWWGLTGWFPDIVYSVVNGTFGWMSLLLPFMLFVCAFRLFRKPQDGRGNNRVGIGFMIMTFAGSGLAHVIGGQPTVADGFEACARQAACSASWPPHLWPPSTWPCRWSSTACWLSSPC